MDIEINIKIKSNTSKKEIRNNKAMKSKSKSK